MPLRKPSKGCAVEAAIVQSQREPIERRLELASAASSTSRVRLVVLACVLAGLVGAFWLVRPQFLGGDTSYVVARGTSMRPAIHDGDLLVLRRGGYTVGDVVAYESPSLGRIVLHRITGVEDGRFVMRGDANGYLDPDRPAPDEVIGRSVVRITGIGDVVAGVRRPAIFVLVTAFFAALVAAGLVGLRRREHGPVAAPVPVAFVTRRSDVFWDAEELAA